MRRGKQFLLNTFILTSTTLLLHFVGVFYSVYITKKIGASAMGIYQLVLSVYRFAVTLSISGIGLCTMRMVAEELTHNNWGGVRAAMRRCLCYGVFFGLLAAGLLLMFGEHIGRVWLRDVRTIKSLYALAISLPMLSVSATLSGYFTAVRRVAKSAMGQVLEQFLKITFSIYALHMLMPPGLEYACLAIVGGGALAEILSSLYLVILYRFEMRRIPKQEANSYNRLTKKMFAIALPIALSSYVRSGLTTIEQIMIPIGLEKSGANTVAALSQYGVIHGMVMPIIFLPSALLSSFASLLIPEMAECREQGNIPRIHAVMNKILKSTLLFSVAVAGIFAFYAQPVGKLLYQQHHVASFILIFSPLVVVMYLDTVVDGMLKGLNEQVSSMRYNIIDAAISVVMVYWLLPPWGIVGYVLVIYISEILNTWLSIRRLIRVTSFCVPIGEWIIKPCLCISAAAFLVYTMQRFVCLSFPAGFLVVICILLTLGFYLGFLWIMGVLTKKDFFILKSLLMG